MTRTRNYLLVYLAYGLACGLACALGAACGGGGAPGVDAAPADAAPAPPPGPYDDVALARDIRLDGLDGPVHVARDRYGIAHIHAESLGDLAFAQGYVMAHDRLPQMDLLRRFGSGTLSELAGAESPRLIDTDLEMRMHRMRPIAEQAYAALQASDVPADAEIVTMLERFAAGVNAYAQDASNIASHDPVAWYTVPVPFQPWTPVDSLVLGRFQAFSLSWTAPIEIDLTDIHQRAIEVFDEAPASGAADFDAARDARRGASRDLLPITPIGTTSPIDGFPAAGAAAAAAAPGITPAAAGSARPRVPQALLDSARQALAPKLPMGPHDFFTPKASSNNWVVGPAHTGGQALLAGDQHLTMSNPSIFYPTHLVVPGVLDVQGITFPGIPGVVLGHNGRVAWSATVANHDVNDVYLEQVVACTGGAGDCVRFDGGEVPIETWTEEIRIGSILSGGIVDTRQVTYELVPHHGPIIPTIAGGAIAPRTGDTALSVRYTGYEITHEIRATYALLRAGDVDQAMAAFEHMGFGAQNWVFADVDGNIGWTTAAHVPLRQAGAYAWDPDSNPRGAAPFFILPGDGGFEWEGYLPRALVPHAVNPARGYLATANSDPVGATFDGNPLNDGIANGRPLYVGVMYAAGLRADRINRLIQERIDQGTTIDLAALADIQHDSQSTFGEHMRPHIVAVLARLDAEPATLSADLIDWIADQPGETLDRLRAAGSYLEGWSLATPPAVQGTPGADQLRDSAATTLFNTWVHFFLRRSVGDEYEALGRDVHRINENLSARLILALLARPESLASGIAPATGQPVLCDDMQTEDVVESCDRVVLEALVLALGWLAGDGGFGTEDMDQWRWGALHTLTLAPLFPDPQGRTLLPPPTDPDPALRGGYPRPGDNFVINRADCGWRSLDFRQKDGPAQRFLAGPGEDGVMRARMALPGGTIFDRGSPHYRDLMDDYLVPERHFDLPFTTGEIVGAGEERWVLRAR